MDRMAPGPIGVQNNNNNILFDYAPIGSQSFSPSLLPALAVYICHSSGQVARHVYDTHLISKYIEVSKIDYILTSNFGNC
jgi:hypothetical protein